MPSENLYINQSQCEGSDPSGNDSAEIRVQIADLDQLAPGAEVLEFWLGAEGVDCHAAWGRAPNASGSSPCIRVSPTLKNVSDKRQNLSLVAHDLFASAGSLGGPCDRVGEQTLYIVPLVNQTPTQVGAIPESGEGSPIAIRFEVDVEPPAPVAAFTGGVGPLTAELTWVNPTPDPLDLFEVYFDTTAVTLANPGPCESELLRTGEPLPVDSHGIDPTRGARKSLARRFGRARLVAGREGTGHGGGQGSRWKPECGDLGTVRGAPVLSGARPGNMA